MRSSLFFFAVLFLAAPAAFGGKAEIEQVAAEVAGELARACPPAAITVAPVVVSNLLSMSPVAGLMRSSFASWSGALTPRGGPANQTPPAPRDMAVTATSGLIVAIRLPLCGSRCVRVPSSLFSTQTPP